MATLSTTAPTLRPRAQRVHPHESNVRAIVALITAFIAQFFIVWLGLFISALTTFSSFGNH
ncbi:hypothetical protein EV140_0886 [Microcella alkaliphila]|uniref:Uncharacterized protein n=1 Tax=Microcella alkaliphila TaxID=279828 RepID=A0A4Q7TP14_9MICO|nr:hypothetical protein EV140_0886 [Microcella alkaliphila]